MEPTHVKEPQILLHRLVTGATILEKYIQAVHQRNGMKEPQILLPSVLRLAGLCTQSHTFFSDWEGKHAPSSCHLWGYSHTDE